MFLKLNISTSEEIILFIFFSQINPDTKIMEKGICPIDTFIQSLKGKRKTTIILHLKQGTKRYGELTKLIPDISDRMMSKQLKELEKDGFISKKIFPVVPPKVEYSLTKQGHDIHPILIHMFRGGKKLENSITH